MKLLLCQFLLGLDAQQHLLGMLEFRPVERLLFPFDFAEQIFLDAIGQILGDLGFGPAQEEGTHAGSEPPPGEGVAFGVVDFSELGTAAEHAGHGKGHQAPEIQQPVFDGRAGQHQAVLGRQRARHLGRLGGWIFDVLALVENHREPPHRHQALAENPELAVVEDVQVGTVQFRPADAPVPARARGVRAGPA